MDNFFFLVSKLGWMIIKPDTLILLLIIAVWLLLWKKSYKLAKRLLSFVVVTLLIIAIVPIGTLMLHQLEIHFQTNPNLPKSVNGIIVLSGSTGAKKSRLWDQVEVGRRNQIFLTLAREFPQAKLVFTGGSGSLLNQQAKDADVAKRLFREQGLDISRVLFERESRNTYENAVFSRKLVEPTLDENWILITTAWHMPRSVGIFCKLGWSVIPYPVDHATLPNESLSLGFNLNGNLVLLNTAIKEWIGLTVYYLTGKTTSLLPQLCR